MATCGAPAHPTSCIKLFGSWSHTSTVVPDLGAVDKIAIVVISFINEINSRNTAMVEARPLENEPWRVIWENRQVAPSLSHPSRTAKLTFASDAVPL